MMKFFAFSLILCSILSYSSAQGDIAAMSVNGADVEKIPEASDLAPSMLLESVIKGDFEGIER